MPTTDPMTAAALPAIARAADWAALFQRPWTGLAAVLTWAAACETLAACTAALMQAAVRLAGGSAVHATGGTTSVSSGATGDRLGSPATRRFEQALLAHAAALPLFGGLLWLLGALTPVGCSPAAARAAFAAFPIAAVAATALAAFIRGPSRASRRPSREPPLPALRAWAGAALVFWSIFAFFAWLRTLNPDLWGPHSGEKPMDFAYLLATVRSGSYPPYNPWLAGTAMNYYYVGFALLAPLVRLTQVTPDMAYNLAVPLLAAMAGAAACVAAARVARLLAPAGVDRDGLPRGRAPVAAALSLLWVLFAGNLAQWRLPWSGIPWGTRAWYWNASRAIASGEPAGPITEFPYFTFLFGDLHAHAMALPLQLLVLALAAGYAASPSLPGLLAAGALAGLLPGVNAWSAPLAAALVLLAVTAAGPGARSRRLRPICHLTAAALAAAAVAWPFLRRYESPVAGPQPWAGPPTPWTDLLLIHGPFVAIGAVAVAVVVVRRFGARLPRGGAVFYTGGWLLALALVAAPEWFTVRGDVGRMNTVFKSYFQAWPLAGVLAAAGVAALFPAGPTRAPARLTAALAVGALLAAQLFYPLTATPARARDRALPLLRGGLDGTAFMAAGMADVRGRPVALRWDLDAIAWLRRNVRGSPVVVEGQLPSYQWGARISAFTGLPTPVGWPWHMRQQLAGGPAGPRAAALDARIDDVNASYRTSSARDAADRLRRLRAGLVVVGPLERALYPAAGLAKFDEAAAGTNAPPWSLLYANPGCRIYAVSGL